MKWLISLIIALFLVTPAMAAEVPYIAVVGNDADANLFYISPKYDQFMYVQAPSDICPNGAAFPTAYNMPYHPTYAAGCEQFRSQFPVNQPEICDSTGVTSGSWPYYTFKDSGNPNARVAYNSAGWFEWYVRLPKAPSGEINLVLQCGVLKPEGFAFYKYRAVNLCAAETGETIGGGICHRETVWPGENPVNVAALPKITAIAYPAVPGSFTPFHLTAFRNPGTYNLAFAKTNSLADGAALQVLSGSAATRILLKSCMDKTVLTKLPVTGQLNSLLETEYALTAGDIIYVRIDIPRQNTVDIYCHEQSLRVMGIGE